MRKIEVSKLCFNDSHIVFRGCLLPPKPFRCSFQDLVLNCQVGGLHPTRGTEKAPQKEGEINPFFPSGESGQDRIGINTFIKQERPESSSKGEEIKKQLLI